MIRAAALSLLIFSLMAGEAQATQSFSVNVGEPLPVQDYPDAAIGLLVPGAGPDTSHEQALAALVRGKVENSLRGGIPSGPALIEVSPAVLAKIAFGDRSDGLVAVIRSPSVALEGLAPGMHPLVVVVEALEKPGNLGAIMRTADAVGASAVIAADPRTDVFNPNAIRASVGTIFSVPLAVATASQALDWLVGHGLSAIAARVDAPQPYADADLGGSIAIVLGSEAGGLTSTWNDPRVRSVRIPMRGALASINAAVAAAIVMSEAGRHLQ